MTAVISIPCPHCGQMNEAGGQFCNACGKALPSANPMAPRIVGAKEFASTSAGQKLQGDQLHATAKKASGALLAVAIIQSIVPALLLSIVASNTRGPKPDMLIPAIIVGAVAAVFWGLYLWSRRQPLPAAIVGLVLYGTLLAINIVTAVSNISANSSRMGGGGIGGLGIGWIDIIIIVVLSKAISAGIKHRQLMIQTSAS